MTAAMFPRFKGNELVTFSLKVGWDKEEYPYDYGYSYQ
jgi:hypothetical protein